LHLSKTFLNSERELAALSECVTLRKRGVKWWFNGLTDPSEAIGRLRVEGASLDPLSICKLRSFANRRCQARSAILAERDNAPVLWQLVQDLPRELNTLVARVTNKILPSGELDDRASPELAAIRHEINTCARESRARSKA
jgi:dsDNA-specific endonuclease/ATPase MutS2